MEMGSRSLGGTGASGSNDSLNGLKFGKKIYFEDVGSAQTSSSSSSSRPPVSSSSPSPPAAMAPAQGRRGRGAVQGGGAQQPPRCQVEGCGQDLTGAKAYYCRHKVCGAHSKAPKVVVAGIEQRFCQQCSRFHQLPEFDQGKRSCRRRLAGHNERRRKPPSGSFSSRYGQLSSSFHEDGGRFGGFLMDFTCPRLPGTARDLWPTTGTSERVTTGSQWPGRLDMPPSGRAAAQVVVPYSQGSAGGTLFSTHEIPSGESLGVSDSSCALSLLSTQQWGTTHSSTRGSAILDNNFGGASMAQSSNASSFMGNPWNSNRHGTNSSIIRGISHDGFGQATEADGGQFSGEPELAPLSNRPCMEHGHGRPYGCSSNHMHWPH